MGPAQRGLEKRRGEGEESEEREEEEERLKGNGGRDNIKDSFFLGWGGNIGKEEEKG